MATPVFFGRFMKYIGDGTIDWDTDTIKVALISSGASAALSTATVWADLSAYEISATGGYTAGGITATGNTVTESGGTASYDLADTVFSASGANIPAWRYAVVYKSGTTNSVTDPLVMYGYDSLSTDVSETVDGTSLTLRWNAAGVFTAASA